MKDFAYKFIARVRQQAVARKGTVTVAAFGPPREFIAYDWGTDTFIFERGVWKSKPARAPVLIVRKDALIEGREGRIMTVSSGAHPVAAIPLLKGLFWNLGRVDDKDRSKVMTSSVLCCNIVGDNIEISQREIPAADMFAADEWLRGLGWSLSNIIIAERNDDALEFYRRRGQEWRIKPLVWTREGMDAAIAASRTHIRSLLTYYQNVKGVHFLSWNDLAGLSAISRDNPGAVHDALAELVAPSSVGDVPAMRDPKFRDHHEIELFGVRDPASRDRIISLIKQSFDYGNLLLLNEAVALFKSSLTFPELADPNSDAFVNSMYKHLTGEVYLTAAQDHIAPAFDDAKTALPGVTYRGTKPDFHPGADDRTRALIDYVESQLSPGEYLEYVNVYELRIDGQVKLGDGPTREIDCKTNLRPTSIRFIEKRLSHQGIEYANYMLARVQAFQSLGIHYGDHHLLARHERSRGDTYFFVRNRYTGLPVAAINRTRLRRPDKRSGTFVDFPEAVLATAFQIGSAAAETMIVKKYIAGSNPVHFAEGKEIIKFTYDLAYRCEMPSEIHLCSIRGSLGWPCTDLTDENFEECVETYVAAFARAIRDFNHEHAGVAPLAKLIAAFNDGFTATTRRVFWNYRNRSETFNEFDPGIRPVFKFAAKWRFALWSIERQYNDLDKILSRITTAVLSPC